MSAVGSAESSLVAHSVTWDSFGLDPRLTRAIHSLGWSNPTLVQSAAIPRVLQGKDVLAKARTGSGKTAAYAVPMIQKILSEKEGMKVTTGIKALILVPTAELCEQVYKVVDDLIVHCRHLVGHIYIGKNETAATEEHKLLLHPDIVIATPARLVQLLVSRKVKLVESLRMIVVDEADLVFSFGYADDVNTIAKYMPRICQGFLASATLGESVESLKKLILHTPVVLKLEEEKDKRMLLQQYMVKNHSRSEKFLQLYVLFKLKVITGKTIVFVNSIEGCYRLKLFLERLSVKSAVLNSELPQNSRYHIVQEFNRGLFNILIATDEANKGEADDSDSEDSDSESASSSDNEGSDSEASGDENEKNGENSDSDSASQDAESESSSSDSPAPVKSKTAKKAVKFSEEEEKKSKKNGEKKKIESTPKKAASKDKKRQEESESEDSSDSEEEEIEENEFDLDSDEMGSDEDEEDAIEDMDVSSGSDDDESEGDSDDDQTVESARQDAKDAIEEIDGARSVSKTALKVMAERLEAVNKAEKRAEREKEAASNTKKGKNQKGAARGRTDSEYGVSRGVDFRGIKTVVNFDFPRSSRAYTHRVGRTARAGQAGTALSFVSDRDNETIIKVAASQKAQGLEIKPYHFNAAALDSFRYRVEGVLRTVTELSIREARYEEIRREILGSQKLQTFFEENPREMELLKHDKSLLESKINPSLKVIPDYILSPTLVSQAKPLADRDFDEEYLEHFGARRKSWGKRRLTSDPLKTFSSVKKHKGREHAGRGGRGGHGSRRGRGK